MGLGWCRNGKGELKDEAIQRRQKEAKHKKRPSWEEMLSHLSHEERFSAGCGAKGAFGHLWGHFVVAVLAFSVYACAGRT